MAGVNAQRAAVGGQLLHVENGEAVVGKNALHRPEREVAEMLVVNGVKLVARNELQQVRKLQGDDSLWLEGQPQPAHEVVQVGHVGQHVVADEQVGQAVAFDDFTGRGAAKKLA